MKKITTKFFLAITLVLASFSIASAQGIMTTWIGDTTAGYTGDGGPASMARLKGPWGVCFDGAYNFYFTDLYNNAIRKVDAITGIITTIAGNGTAGYTGDGGPATNATLDEPIGLCCDAAGNLYFAEIINNVIRKVDARTGIITTICGTGATGFSGDGGPATAATINYPGGLCLDATASNLYFADLNNNVVRKISLATGMITTICGNTTAAYTGDGGLAAAATLSEPTSVCFDPWGNLYISDHNNYVIRKINATTGIITTIAGNGINGFTGDGGPALSAQIGSIYGMCCDGHGDIYINDWSCSCRKISCSSGIITLQAGEGILSGYNGDGGCDTLEMLCTPVGVCVDPRNGDIIIADLSNHSIRNATQPGYVSTTAVGQVPGISQFTVFPNPSTGIFTIQTSIPQKNSSVEVYNTMGELVFTSAFTGIRQDIDISSQVPGVYLIRCITAGGISTASLILK